VLFEHGVPGDESVHTAPEHCDWISWSGRMPTCWNVYTSVLSMLHMFWMGGHVKSGKCSYYNFSD